jgi:hypothetical protein
MCLYVCVCLGPPGSTATLHLTRGDKELEPVTLLRVSGPLGVGLLLVRENKILMNKTNCVYQVPQVSNWSWFVTLQKTFKNEIEDQAPLAWV